MTVDQVIAVLRQAGFSGIGLVNALATVLAENGKLDPNAIHVNNDPAITPKSYLGSFDVGLFQINTTAHPQYTTAQLQDPLTNAQAAYQISQGGTNFGQWSTWIGGEAERLIATATADILGVGSSTSPQTAGVSAQTAAQSPIATVYNAYSPPAQATTVVSGLNATASSITSAANALTTIPTAIATAVASVERIFWIVIGLVIALAGIWLLVQSE